MRTGIKSKNTDSNLKEAFTAPPKLEANVEFFEPNGNNYLDALEEGYFLVTINNTGKGPGKDIKINITAIYKCKIVVISYSIKTQVRYIIISNSVENYSRRSIIYNVYSTYYISYNTTTC